MADLLRHPRDWAPAQAYRSPGRNDIWVVEAVYAGPTVIYADKAGPLRNTAGVVHFANRDLGVRLVAFVDDPKLDKLIRISA